MDHEINQTLGLNSSIYSIGDCLKCRSVCLCCFPPPSFLFCCICIVLYFLGCLIHLFPFVCCPLQSWQVAQSLCFLICCQPELSRSGFFLCLSISLLIILLTMGGLYVIFLFQPSLFPSNKYAVICIFIWWVLLHTNLLLV